MTQYVALQISVNPIETCRQFSIINKETDGLMEQITINLLSKDEAKRFKQLHQGCS